MPQVGVLAPTLCGGNRQADRQMRLADAGRPEEDDIFPALDEAELVQTLHLLATQRRLEREIKLGGAV